MTQTGIRKVAVSLMDFSPRCPLRIDKWMMVVHVLDCVDKAIEAACPHVLFLKNFHFQVHFGPTRGSGSRCNRQQCNVATFCFEA